MQRPNEMLSKWIAVQASPHTRTPSAITQAGPIPENGLHCTPPHTRLCNAFASVSPKLDPGWGNTLGHLNLCFPRSYVGASECFVKTVVTPPLFDPRRDDRDLLTRDQSLRTTAPPIHRHRFCKLAEAQNICHWRSRSYVKFQVCKTRHSFCKLAFFANLPRRHDTPWHFARTDIACPRSRAKRCTLSSAGSVASNEKSRVYYHVIRRRPA
jgi:hypothetical protein